MTAVNPSLAAAIAAKRVPLSADWAPSSTERIVRDALGSVQGTVHHLGLVTLEVLVERLTEALQKHAQPQPATPRWHQLRTELIRTFRPYMPETAATKAVDLVDEVIAEALLEGARNPSPLNLTDEEAAR